MCTGLEIIGPIVAAGLSAAGGMVTAREQQRNAERQAEARNNELKRTLVKNDKIADESRNTFKDRSRQMEAEQANAEQEKQTQDRTETLETAVAQTPADAGDVALSGSAPTVVKSEIAKRMGEALAGAKGQAQAQAKLGGYGDAWLSQGFKDAEAGRDLAQNANFAAGNMALLPYSQDFAETRAYKPISPLGGLLQGAGSVFGSWAGGGGATPRRRYTSPVSQPGAYI